MDFAADVFDITAVSTQGRSDADEWVTSFTISYSTGGSLSQYTEGGTLKVCVLHVYMCHKGLLFRVGWRVMNFILTLPIFSSKCFMTPMILGLEKLVVNLGGCTVHILYTTACMLP